MPIFYQSTICVGSLVLQDLFNIKYNTKKSLKNFLLHFAISIHPPTFALQIKKRKFKVL